MTAIALGILMRFGQLAIEASLTLLVGVVVAGILRRMAGPAGTRHLFGRGWRGLLRGWLAGVLLPVCSLGVIPVARELRRVGVPGGTILSFVLSAPLLNPISFLYGLTLADPTTILTFSAFSLVLSTVAGFLWDRFSSSPDDVAIDADRGAVADREPLPGYGIKRIASVFVTAVRELTGRDLAFYAIGLLGSAVLSGFIPNGSLQRTMQHTDRSSPVLMAAIAVPVFSSPLPGMMKIGLMFDHGNSVAAAFVLFSLGVGLCLGTIAWLLCDFPPGRIVGWFSIYLAMVLGLGYATQPLLDDPRRERIDHTHAFDDYASPFHPGPVGFDMVLAKWKEKFTPLERPTVYGLAAALLTGFAVRRIDRDGRIERWLTAIPAPGTTKFDVNVPTPILAGTALAGLVAMSVIGAYLYYPDRKQCLDEMFAVYADARVAVGSNRPTEGADRTQEAIRHLERWDWVVRKLEVGHYLRTFRLTDEQKRTAYDLREAIEELRDHLRDGEIEQAKAELKPLDLVYKACKDAYAIPPAP
jgi:hypothetical protein